MRGVNVWITLFEKVIVPMAGLGAFVYAALGGPVPIPLYPMIGLMLGLPALRWLDRIRKNGSGT